MSVQKSIDQWFNMPAGTYCGVLIKEKTAKKLQKILWRQTQELKEFFATNRENLLPMNWTLAYPDGKQTVVYYSDAEDCLDDRINVFDLSCRIRHVDGGVFISDKKFNEARKEVESFVNEMYSEGLEQ